MMNHPTSPATLTQRVAPVPAVPTSHDWLCCVAAASADPVTFLARLYHAAHQHAATHANARRPSPGRHAGRWN